MAIPECMLSLALLTGSPPLLPGLLPLERILCYPPWITFGVRMKAELLSLTETVPVSEPLGAGTRRLLPTIPRGCSSRWLPGSPTSRLASRHRLRPWASGFSSLPCRRSYYRELCSFARDFSANLPSSATLTSQH